MPRLILEGNFSVGSARSSRPGPIGSCRGHRCGCSPDVGSGHRSTDAPSTFRCERSPGPCGEGSRGKVRAGCRAPTVASRGSSTRGSFGSGRRPWPDVGCLRSSFRSRSGQRLAATIEEKNHRGSSGGCSIWGNTLFHLGERGVPYGGTKCSTWGYKNMELMEPMEFHGGRQRKPSPWRAPVPPPGR
ncbi:MAG: hypothetical protein RLZZ326_1732 [Planctomycetota bacterium]